MAHNSLQFLTNSIQQRQLKVTKLRNQIEDIEQQNNRILRADKHQTLIIEEALKMIDFNLMSVQNEEDLINCDYLDNNQIDRISAALQKIQESYQLLADRRKKMHSLGNREKDPRFVQDALASLSQHRKDSFDKFIGSFQAQIQSMIDPKLVSTDKPKQVSMTWVLMLLESEEWSAFVKRRVPLMQQFGEIKYMETRAPEEINKFYRRFYEPVSITFSNDFMADFKCKLILQFFTQNVLEDIQIPSTVASRKTQ